MVNFSENSLNFLKLAGKQKNADWLDKNDAQYQQLIRIPLITLANHLKISLADDAQGYHFPVRAIGRIKKASNKVEEGGHPFKDWVSYISTRPSSSRFEKNPLLFFGLLPNDKDWKGVVVAGGLYMATSTQTRRVRQAISDDPDLFKNLFADKHFKKSFKVGFDPMTKAVKCPRGFDPDHSAIEWLKLKTFFVSKKLTMAEFTSPDLAKDLVNDFKQILKLNQILETITADR